MRGKLCVLRAWLGGAFAAAALALALAACGGGSGSTAASTVASATPQCERQLTALTGDLDVMRGRMIREPGYRKYVQDVRLLQAGYASTPFSKLDVACLQGPATVAEQAVDRYVAAANAWSRCLASSGCDLQAAKTAVARQWWLAGLAVSKLHQQLPGTPDRYLSGLPFARYIGG
jgi:hypothetical protein